MKDTWTITRRVETGEGGREDWWGLGGVGEKGRKLYLNNNKKMFKKIKKIKYNLKNF